MTEVIWKLKKMTYVFMVLMNSGFYPTSEKILAQQQEIASKDAEIARLREELQEWRYAVVGYEEVKGESDE